MQGDQSACQSRLNVLVFEGVCVTVITKICDTSQDSYTVDVQIPILSSQINK